MIHLDTHVVVWLVAGLHAKIPATILDRLEREPIATSPIVRLELTYLFEIQRLRHPADPVLAELSRASDAVEDRTPFAEVARAATALSWTRDPFDRLICAQAIAADCALVSADRTILRHLGDRAIWD